MNVNFDLLISGCNTRCRHCYVNGGPGGLMPLDDALRCIGKLDEIAAFSELPMSFTLDNEPINHPGIVSILGAASSVAHIEHFHHGMTTGIALLARADRDAVVDAYFACGCRDFGVTLHGSPERHDGIVRRKGAFKASVEAAEYLCLRGAKMNVSLMFNRFFPEDADTLDRTIEKLRPEFVCFAIPNYTPHKNMPGFEPWRGSLDDLRALSPYLEKWGQDAKELLCRAEQGTAAALIRRFEGGLTLPDLFREEQDELYLSVHGDCKLYLGNTGAETRLIGDLRTLDAEKTAKLLRETPGNRDYGAFYDETLLPGREDFMKALHLLPPDTLYSDPAGVVYRALDELHIPTKIL